MRRNQYIRQGARPKEENPREPEGGGKPLGQRVATIAIPDEPSGKKKNENVVSIIRLKRMIEDITSEMEEEQAKVVKRARMPMVTIKFNSINIEALMDTGAQISAVTRASYDKLVRAGEKMHIIPIRKFALKGAFSEKGSLIANKIRLQFQFLQRTCVHEFYIVERMAYELILGIDFMTKMQMVMKCGDQFHYELGKDARAEKTIAAIQIT